MSPNTATASKDGRYWVNIPFYYFLQLKVEAWLKGRSLPQEGGSLLCAKLHQRKAEREEMLNLVASEMGITRDKLWRGIIDGTIEPNPMPINSESVPTAED